MTAARFVTTPSPERRTFFLRVARRANEMQRDLVGHERSRRLKKTKRSGHVRKIEHV